ncbi:MAG: GYD domain-containing protein [Methylocystis sp.]|uniref:GYD domain-containing protein n=1 Tax=Methylocystis sp. TaxID=1911079 RepID=UPI003DA5A5C1
MISYAPAAWAAFLRTPQDRAAASDALLQRLGGRLIGLYYTPGADYDGFALFEAPDDATAAAAEIADVAGGHLSRNRIVRILSAEEMQAALQKGADAPIMAPR